MITIYTDGSYVDKYKIGGWAAIVVEDDKETVSTGGVFHSKENAENITAQRMEVQAVLEGLFTLSRPSEVNIITDSSYVCDTISKGWLLKWIEEGDYTKKHFDLWRMIYNLMKIHKVTIERVKAHNGHYYNERCDTLAKNSAQNQINTPEYIKMYGKVKIKKKVKLPETPKNNEFINRVETSKEGDFYAVAIGRKIGVFHTWHECQKQIHKYKGAKFKKFGFLSEAENFINENKR